MKIEKILFLDIETVAQTERYSELSEDVAELWREKYDQLKSRAPDKYEQGEDAESYISDMGLFAEFGKIACISMGVLCLENNTLKIRLKSIYDTDERKILTVFHDILAKLKNYQICGHNIKEFDIPYIARRMIINNIPLPQIILDARKKPWSSPILDTMDLWKFGDYKHYTSLKLLCNTLGVKSPKEDIAGKDVYRVFYQEKDLDRISHYCENDVIATIQVFLKLSGKECVDEGNIERMTNIDS